MKKALVGTAGVEIDDASLEKILPMFAICLADGTTATKDPDTGVETAFTCGAMNLAAYATVLLTVSSMLWATLQSAITGLQNLYYTILLQVEHIHADKNIITLDKSH